MSPASTLGTRLRHLIELLDGAVEDAYRQGGLDYRPRYTPVVRALIACGPASIQTLAQQAGITHSAVSQTVTQMARDGLVERRPGADARERIVALSAKATAILPQLQAYWAAVTEATLQMEAELGAPLSEIAGNAITVLSKRPFADRIAQALDASPSPLSGASHDNA